MSYVGLGGLTAEQMAEFRSLMPGCWSQEFEDCWVSETPPSERGPSDPPSTFPNCARLFELYGEGATDEAGRAQVEAVPNAIKYCDEPAASPLLVGAVAAVAGVVAGAVLCSVGR